MAQEIVYLVSNGARQWIAKEEHSIIPDIGTQLSTTGSGFAMRNFVEYKLWHVPSGPLPIQEPTDDFAALKYNTAGFDGNKKLENPWEGWTERRTGANARTPYFGAGHPGVFDLEIKLPEGEEIRMSSFGWIGNHYKIIGNGADGSTEKFWNKLRRMAKKVGTQIPRANNPEGRKEIYAFPKAYEEIKNGRACSVNP